MAGIDRLSENDIFKREILVNFLVDASIQDRFSSSLNEKLRKSIVRWDLKNHLNKINISEKSIPFGVEFKDPIFTPNEKKCIQLELEEMIVNEFPPLLDEFHTLTHGEVVKRENEKYTRKDELTAEQYKVIQLCSKYYEQLEQLKNINIEMCTMMREWVDLRLGVMAQKLSHKAEICSLKSKLMDLEADIVGVRIKRFVYGGNSQAVKDYMDYYNNLLGTLEKYKQQISEYKKILRNNSLNREF